MSYTDVYGGSTVQPTDVSYGQLTLSANTTLTWPALAQEGDTIAARIMRVTATITGLRLILPSASQVSQGQDILIVNYGANAFTIVNNDGSTIVSSAAGNAHYIYLIDNTTNGGTWAVVLFGASASAVNASALAGQGLLAIASTLNANAPVTTISSAYTLGVGDRAHTVVNTGGSITVGTTSAATLGNGWFALLKNSGSGTMTIDPSGAQTIDGLSTLALNPTESLFIVSDGTNFYTIGRGRAISSAYTRLSKSVAGNTDVTLTSTEAAFSILSFTGTLTGNINIVAPTTVNEWIVENNLAGAFTATFKTAAGTGVSLGVTASNIDQGAVNPAYCDGTNIRLSATFSSAALSAVAGGTGINVGTSMGTATVSLANTTVAAGNYGTTAAKVISLTLDAQGRATTASEQELLAQTANIAANAVTNAKLATMAARTVKANLTGSTAVPTDATVSDTLDVLAGGAPGSVAQGTVMYRDSASWAFLAPGTSGQYLQTLGAAANPAWAGFAAPGRLIDVSVYTSSGTWNKPAGTTAVEVEVVGGGGGGGSPGGSPTAGGTSSFGGHNSATGGGVGQTGVNQPGGTGGVGSGGTLNIPGQPGGNGAGISNLGIGGTGGNSKLGQGAPMLTTTNSGGLAGSNGSSYGGGGSGAAYASTSNGYNHGGGGGGYSYLYLTSGILTSETITVGAGGSGASAGVAAGNGASGVVIVKSYS